MRNEYLRDSDFLRELDRYVNKFYLVKIIVLDMDENPISAIEGRVQSNATIQLVGNSAVRRTCSLTFTALEAENDLTDIDNLLAINRKIRIEVGIVNNFTDRYDNDIFWFPQGVFVIINPSISHSANGCTISLSCKDKMALLNGECGGNLPASITFHEYDQIIGRLDVTTFPASPNDYTVYYFATAQTRNGITSNYWSWNKREGWYSTTEDMIGEIVSEPNLIYDIIQTLVCNYGGESIDKIIINDVPLEIKQLVRNVGSNTLFYRASTGEYSTNQDLATDTTNEWLEFETNEDCGYVYTDFIYPSDLISGIGENICSVLDKIKNTLGNFEYFYDIDGNFVFQEIRNYLNVSYVPTSMSREVIPTNFTSGAIIGANYDTLVNFDNDTDRENFIIEIVNQQHYFSGSESANYRVAYPSANSAENNYLLLTFVNEDAAWEKLTSPFIVNDGNYLVDYNSNKKSIYTFNAEDGMITQFSNSPNYTNIKNDFHIWGKEQSGFAIHYHLAIKSKPRINSYYVKLLDDGNLEVTDSTNGILFTPQDWRVELYLRGKQKQALAQRPDIYEQEIIDMISTFYQFKLDNGKIVGEYLYDITKVNTLKYFIDYLEPVDDLYDCSVDLIGSRIYSYQQDKIVRLYNKDVPNVIIVNKDGDSIYNSEIITRCGKEGQPYVNVSGTVYSTLSIGTIGYSAQETARDLMYQYTDYNNTISFQCMPIYYLEPNTRITVNDRMAGIHGDYIITSINRPLGGQGTMTISATRALERM